MSHSNDQSLWDRIRVELEGNVCVCMCVCVCVCVEQTWNITWEINMYRNVQTHILVCRYEIEGRVLNLKSLNHIMNPHIWSLVILSVI